MDLATKEGALEALSGMRVMVEADMVAKVGYVEAYPSVPERKDAICGGHKACALGSLYLGAGVKPVPRCNAEMRLPGVDQGWTRESFLAEQPALKLAYDALHQAAVEYDDEHLVMASDDSYWDDEADEHVDVAPERVRDYSAFRWMPEALFEDGLLDPKELLPMIERAEELIEAGEVVSA